MSIFGAMDLGLAAMMLIILLIFTLVWEDLTQRLELAVQDHEHYAAMVGKVYRELMILGFISFTVVISNEFQLMEHSTLIPFEFAHLIIFGVSMFYVGTTIVSTERLTYTNNQWERMANTNTNKLADDLEYEAKATNVPPGSWKPLWNSSLALYKNSLWEDAEWKLMRVIFLREFDIGTEFDYSKYVKVKLRQKLSHSLHIHPSTWGLVMVMSLIYYAYDLIFGNHDDADGAHRRLAAVAADECVVSDFVCALENITEVPIEGLNDTYTHMCVLGDYEEPEDPIAALIEILMPCLISWLLVIGQGYVLFQTKAALHRVLSTKGCPDARSMPEFLRSQNAMVQMRSLLPHIPMFEGSGDEFMHDVINSLTLQFFTANDIISKKGDVGHSMYFICTGCADVKTTTGKVLGSLTAGDYFGEVALLLDQPRSANVTARNKCAIFELDRSALDTLSAEFPAAVERMVNFADKRAQAAIRGQFDKSGAVDKAQEDLVVAHSNRLKEIQRQRELAQQEQGDDTARFSLKLGNASIKGALAGAKAIANKANDAAHAAAGAARNPLEAAASVAKKAAHSVGLPGTGLSGAHSAHGSHALDRMEGADAILSHDKNHFHEEIAEITMLLNCFCFAYWGLRLAYYTIPNLYVGGEAASFPVQVFCHFMMIFPSFIVTVWLGPVATKYSCLLDNVLFKDNDAIAEVYHTMSRLIALKNQIRKQLAKVGSGLARDVGMDEDLVNPEVLAKLLFDEIDSKGSGKATYQNLRKALANFGVYMSRKESTQMMEFIDPDRDGVIELAEWSDFLSATDEQLQTDEWQDTKRNIAVRSRLSAELVRKALAMESLGVGSQEGTSVGELNAMIFAQMDKDKNGALSVAEIQNGLMGYGIELKSDDLHSIVSFMEEQSAGSDELTLDQWRDYINEHEQSLPEGEDVWGEEKGATNGATSPRSKPDSDLAAFEVDVAPGMDNPLAVDPDPDPDPASPSEREV